MPIVGLEPSCTGVLRSDLVELLDTDAARAVSAATVTVAELLAAHPRLDPAVAGRRAGSSPSRTATTTP